MITKNNTQLTSQKEFVKINDDLVKLATNFALKHHDEKKDEKEIEWEIVPNSGDFDLEGFYFSIEVQCKK